MYGKRDDRKRSRELAAKLYDRWVRQRQHRPEIRSSDDPKKLEKIARENFKSQLVEPRKRHLAELRKVADEMSFADQAALLVLLELPTLETSTLLHRLARQLTDDPDATYFSETNLADNCGCGCGCCCAAMVSLDYEEQIATHHRTKPFSIDPFNELETPTEVRDELRTRDFLASFEQLSANVHERVNARYHQIAEQF